MDVAAEVARHYTHGALLDAILAVLRKGGKDVEHLKRHDLAGADEFHLGWSAATGEFAQELDLSSSSRLLDVGSGLGGPARHFAEVFGAHVTGIDLTQEYVDVANDLTRRCRLSDHAIFRQASGLDLPFADASFDRASLIHVGMNIDDKPLLFSEIRRVLEPGAIFAIYDIMRMNSAELPYPMPWAATQASSFVATPDIYRSLLSDAGFAIEGEKNRSEMSLLLGRQMREDAERNGAPPLGLHTLMGPATPQRLGNVMATLAAGTIAPIQILARAI